MRKQLRIVMACLSLLLLISGCVERRAKDNQVEGQQFTVEYKQNAESQRGKATALFGNRIYYFGRDNEVQGIYCMSLDGSDVQFIVATSDIRRLQIRNNTSLYFVGFAGETENQNGKIALYRPYHYDMSAESKVDILEHVDDADAPHYKTIWDLYVNDKGTCFFTRLIPFWPQSDLNLSFFSVSDGRKILQTDYEEVAYVSAKGLNNTADFPIVQYQSVYVSSIYLYISEQETTLECDGNPSMYSLATKEPIFGVDVQFINRLSDNTFQERTMRAVKDGSVFLSSNNELYEYSLIGHELTTAVSLRGPDDILFVWQTDTGLLILAQNFFEQQDMYYYDFETKSITNIYKAKRQERIVHADATKMILIEGSEVSILQFGNGWATNRHKKQALSSILQKQNIVEICGDWLFIYKYDEHDAQRVLIERIDLR